MTQPKMTAQEIMKLVADKYADKPDKFILSLGHWETNKTFCVPEFHAFLQLSMKEVRQMAGVKRRK